ncbi:MAG TPA: hypothetical protein ENJ95_16265 [Bacteroidetes bacterium]|nr:hypothetical protein [Bacteroidota bacterium]
MKLETITGYLENKKWKLNRIGEKYLFYEAPAKLGFSDPFLLPVPRRKKADDFGRSLQDTAAVISDIYEVNVESIALGITDYLEILKKDAIYFNISSENVMYQKTLEINDVWNFLKNLTAAYTNYIKIEFQNKFYHLFNADKSRIKKLQNKLVELTRLRVVALDSKTFSFGISADSMMGRTEIEHKEIQKWREQVIKLFFADIIKTDFGSRNEVERILEKYNEGERRKIFEPYISSINNNSDFTIAITDKNFKTKKTIKRISNQIVDIILPKNISANKPQRSIGFYRTIIPVDMNKSAIKLKVSDFAENNLFTQKLDALDGHISYLVHEEKTVQLQKQIDFTVNYDEQNGLFQILVPGINIHFSLKDFNELQQEFNNQFSTLISYYLNIKGKPDVRSREIIAYLKSILPGTFF